jgi:RNA polymerase sigma-70 factor (ECF subfamily)
MEPTDLAIVARARLGDADAFRALVERHSRPLFRLAFRMTGNQQDAEDVVQESFLRAWRQLGRFDERASFGTWLYRIATNCSLDLMRGRKRRPAVSDEEDPVLALPSGDPTPERVAMGMEDVGRVLGCQPGAAKHSVFRAVRKLRRALEPLASGAR